MEILKFLSFGRWNIILDDSTENVIITMFVILCLTLLIKFATNVKMDSNSEYNVKSPIRYLVRLLHVFLYLVLLSITSLFNSYNYFIIVELILFAYFIVIGVGCLVDDCDEYFSVENIYIAKLERKIDKKLSTNKYNAQIINNINKSIYDYRKNAIIG